MKKIKLFLLYFFILGFIIYLFSYNDLELVVNESLNTFFTRVFPSLFPMFIFCDLLISFNFVYYINKFTSKVFYKLFKLNGSCAYILVMSLLSGTPVNAVITNELYNNNYLSKDDATRIISFTLFLNPLFLYVMLSVVFDLKTTLFLIINNYVCSFILGIILRKDSEFSSNSITLNKFNISNSIINSISKSINLLTMILGTIVFFNLIKFDVSNTLINIILSGFFEIAGGLSSLEYGYNLFINLVLASSMISFCGLCIHIQIKSIIADTINYKLFLKNRLIHLFLSCLGCVAFYLTCI